MRLSPERREWLKVARVIHAQDGDEDALQIMADALPAAIEDIEELERRLSARDDS